MPSTDPILPAADVLLGDDASPALGAAVAPAGGAVRGARLRQVDYLPGERLVASYDALVDWPDGPAEEILGAAVFADGATRGERTAEIAGMAADLWCYPDDPYLPGLRDAIAGDLLVSLLEELGVPSGSMATVRGYSPRSRAVMEIVAPPAAGKLVFRPGQGFGAPARETQLFLKFVPPEQVDRLVAAHEALAGAIPVARVVHADRSRGLLAITPLAGVPLWSCIVDGADRPLDPGEILAVLDSIKDVPLESGARTPATETVRLNLRTLAAVLPGQADALARFDERLGEPAPQTEITVHGDLHEVQLLVSGGALSGVLDLDDAGRGHRVDDLAMLLGRLHAYARDEPRHAAKLDAYVDAALAAWEGEVDPAELRRSVCAVCMSHALQPFRSQEPEWPARCERGIAVALELQARLLGQ